MKTHAVRFHVAGAPDVLRWEEVELSPPGPGEAQIRHTAIGLNYLDVYQRNGLYPLPMPACPGSEGVGVVEAVGPGVTEVVPGDRVAYGNAPPGAYAEQRNLPAHRLVMLPEDVPDETAAAMMLKGLTVQYLVRRTHRVQPGETILVHAAAGGVGLILCQWANALGATVIGTVGSPEKAAVAREHGCHHVLDYREGVFAAEVRKLTGGRGVRVVYDGVGKATFMESLDCLEPLGLMVSFGNASGAVPPFNPLLLSQKGSLFFTRPTLFTYVEKRSDLLAAADELFEVVRSGRVKVAVSHRFPLREAARAHEALESRTTTGSSILLP